MLHQSACATQLCTSTHHQDPRTTSLYSTTVRVWQESQNTLQHVLHRSSKQKEALEPWRTARIGSVSEYCPPYLLVSTSILQTHTRSKYGIAGIFPSGSRNPFHHFCQNWVLALIFFCPQERYKLPLDPTGSPPPFASARSLFRWSAKTVILSCAILSKPRPTTPHHTYCLRIIHHYSQLDNQQVCASGHILRTNFHSQTFPFDRIWSIHCALGST